MHTGLDSTQISLLVDIRDWYDVYRLELALIALKRPLKKIFVFIRTKDKGGMIFSPQVGLHENVVVLDYDNEYANLILIVRSIWGYTKDLAFDHDSLLQEWLNI